MPQAPTTVQSDFDRLALLSQDGWNHNSHYHRFLLQHIPSPCRNALEIGCGTGAFARLLAQQSDRVLSLDLSPQMIRIARERSTQHANIEFQVADALTWHFPSERFDCIVSIATLHHLPIDDMLLKLKEALRVNGTLLVLDLYQTDGLSDALTSIMAMPMSVAWRLWKHGRLRESRAVHAAWAAHSRTDSYMSLKSIRQTCARILPGAIVTKHLLWRYSLIWQKAASS